jgi:hypothetical protein
MGNPLKKVKISQPWGRPNPRYAAKRHTGIDYACPVGTPVLAIVNATVKAVLTDKAYGKVVVITYKVDGVKYDTWYCHLSAQSVKVGAKVAEGDVLGKSGNTGNSTGPHLHLETRIKPFRYGNDVACPVLLDPKVIDQHAPSSRKPKGLGKVVAALKPTTPKVTKKVHMTSLVIGAINDDVKVVQAALIDLVGATIKVTGKFDKATSDAYKLWQHKLGFHGKDADGIPGRSSLTSMGKAYGFKVV